jgi:hypothetical protein
MWHTSDSNTRNITKKQAAAAQLQRANSSSVKILEG